MLAKRPENPAATGFRNLRAAASVIAAGLLLGAVASVVLRTGSEWMAPGEADAAPAQAAPASPAHAPVPAPAVKPLAPAPVPVSAVKSPAAAKVTTTVTTTVKPAPVSGPVKTMSPAIKPATGPIARPGATPGGVQSPARLDDQVTYQYNALGRRDPFQAMVGGDFIGADVGGDAPIDVGGMKVVGVVWGTEDKFALVEDGRGNSLVLRPGDKVMNGVVDELKRDAVVVKLTVDGQTQYVAIPMTRKGDHSNANR